MAIPTLEGINEEIITSSRLSSRVLFSGDENGIPVVFVHGNVSSATFWEETMLALPSGYRGIAPDNRGYGGADYEALIDATRGCKDWSDDLASLLDTLEIETAHVVGHSLGGAILWQFMMDYPTRIRTVTQIAPGSPFGFGGTKGLSGEMCFPDSAGSGGGIVSPDFAKAVAENDRSTDEQNSPVNVMNAFYWKPPFVPERIDDLLSSALSIHTGENRYPGDATASENWPMAAPGKFGPNNALAPLYADDINKLYVIDTKPPVLWVRGDSDQIVSDSSFFELGTLGQMGAVPGWPGEDIFPPQPMVGQTRAVLETYGDYQEVVIADASHSPYIEKPTEFNQAFHAHLQQFDA